MSWRHENLPWLAAPPKDLRAQCAALDEADRPDASDIIRLAGTNLNTNQLIRLSDSIKRARDRQFDPAPLSPFHLDVIGNGTTCLYVSAMPAAAARHGVLLSVTQAEYDQVMQEALNPTSAMNARKPDALLLALDFHGLPFTDNPSATPRGDNSFVHSPIAYLETIRQGIEQGSGAPVVFQTLACPPAPVFGSLDARIPGSLRSQIAAFNDHLRDLAAKRGDYVLDLAALAEMVGTQNWHDPIQWNSYKLPFAQTNVPIYVEHVGRLLGAIRGNSRKCLVLDLDNTVWGGVIGDDGLDGIAIGQGDGVSEAHLELQKTALILRERGIILAVCSKNDDNVARQPFREHSEMLLKENHIAVFQANWNDKATNLEAIAEALNIGTDALVFLDDNPVERKQVRDALPTVAVPELPADPSLFSRALVNAGYFESIGFSEEDKARADQYQANAQRAALVSGARDMREFLSSLEMRIEFLPFRLGKMARVAQLINKSNQFNLTARRYTQTEVEALAEDADFITLQIRVIDRFGDNGIIGVIIGRQNGAECDIDCWLMSCRVLGRRVEEAMLSELVRIAKARGIELLVGHYVPTAKNGLVSDHYVKLGFTPSGRNGNTTIWRLPVADYQCNTLPFEVLALKATI